jgi:hypothetical protein
MQGIKSEKKSTQTHTLRESQREREIEKVSRTKAFEFLSNIRLDVIFSPFLTQQLIQQQRKFFSQQ